MICGETKKNLEVERKEQREYFGVFFTFLMVQIRVNCPYIGTLYIYSTPKETHHLYVFTIVKKFNWR